VPPASASGKPGAARSDGPRHDAAYWAEKTQGYDFSAEDKLDAPAFNLVLWNGLKGESQPYPAERDGRDLSKNRKRVLQEFNRSAR